jgi:dipeptidyl aminopeptidase/acylaminoacyl peptidase
MMHIFSRFFGIFLLVLLTACGSTNSEISTVSVEEIPEIVSEVVVEVEAPDDCEEVRQPSLQYYICHPVTGKNLVLSFVEDRTATYTRYAVMYEVGELKLSGVLLIPVGDGPFPLVVTNHGHIDTSVYTRGRGLKREQDALAKVGFAVLHPDYRNHAESDKDPESNKNLRLGYVEDVMGGIIAVRDSDLPELQVVDATRVGMIGHSMGGGISMQVAVVAPDLVDAIVLYAPVSSDARKNFERYQLGNRQRVAVVHEVFEEHGTFEENPQFWDDVSPSEMFDRLKVPVHIHIGSQDESTPPEWSEEIYEQMVEAGAEVEIFRYEGEKHEFIPQWETFKGRFVELFGEL